MPKVRFRISNVGAKMERWHLFIYLGDAGV
jgi:hypothetical protein